MNAPSWRRTIIGGVMGLLLCWEIFGGGGMASEKPLVITDALGRTVTVSVPVSKAIIVITYELIPALDLWERIGGVSRWAEEECDLYRAMVGDNPHLRKPHVGVGTDVNVETVIALKPDVVVTWGYSAHSIQFLEAKGIPVVALWPDSIEDLYGVIRLHGSLFGKEERAEEVIREMDYLFSLIRERIASIPPGARRKAIHLLGKPTTVSCKIGITHDIIALIGGINPAGEIAVRNADLSLERIMGWMPDVIFIWGNAGYTAEWLIESSSWRVIKAVREGQVYKLPKWSTWSPRLPLIALWMAQKLYPERFSDITFDEIAESFYRKIFGISYRKVRELDTRKD